MTEYFSPTDPSYVIQPGVTYRGWCLQYDKPIDELFLYCNATNYFVDELLPDHLVSPNWGYINYIINTYPAAPAIDVQAAIWHILQGYPTNSPVSTTIASDALANGAAFVPALGQKRAVIVDLGPDIFYVQPVILEVTCGTPPPPPPLDQCAQEAVRDPSINNNATYAFALGTILGNDFITGPQSLKFIQQPDGSVLLTGVVVRASNPNLSFNASVTFSNPSSTAPAGYPQKLIPAANSTGWTYYSNVLGKLVGQKGLAGTNIVVAANGAQFGFGANNNNLLNGYFSTITWLPTDGTSTNILGGSSSGSGVLAGQIIECPDVDQICLNQALPVSGVSGGHAFYLPGIGTDFVSGSVPLRLIESSNGKASITGVVYSASNPCKGFIVDIALSGLTDIGPSGSPKLELPGFYYAPTGIVDTNSWRYYSNMVGTLTGIDCFAGGLLSITRTGPAPQFGIGANGKNTNDGGSAWFTVTVVKNPKTGSAFCPTSHGDFNLDTAPCVDEEVCVDEAYPALVSGGHALYLPGIGTDFIAIGTPLKLTKYEDGTALLSGNVYSKANTNRGFAINVKLSGLVEPPAPAPSGSPKLELPSTAYVPTGPVNPTNWTYYTAFSGTLSGLGQFAGGSLSITRTGPSFQLGYGASGKNTNDGGSGWFTVTVLKHPSCGITFCPTSHGDFNLDIAPCVYTPPACPTIPTKLEIKLNASSKAVLTWKDNSTNETCFVIERKVGTYGSWTKIAEVTKNSTNYTDTSVEVCKTYCYRIRSCDCAEYSNSECITVTPPCPNPPTNLLVVSNLYNKVIVKWTDNSSNESCFIIERKTGANGTWSQVGKVNANCTTFSDLCVKDGVTYVYRVRTCDCTDYTNEITVTTPSCPPPTVCGNGLQGCYYNSKDLTCFKFSRIDGTVNFDWGNGSPGSGLYSDKFSVRWTGQIQADYTQTYTFYVTGDDGVRLWVNGVKIIDGWCDQAAKEYSGTIALVAGRKYDIKLEYYESTGGAVAKLAWSSASTPKQIVPKCNLFSGGYTGHCQVAVPWQQKDVGGCALPGDAKDCGNGSISISCSGEDIWGSSDKFRFVYQNASGDCEIKAKVCEIGNSDAWAKAGVMIRESLNGNSSHAFMALTSGNGLAFQRRNGTGYSSEHTSGGTTSDCWVKLVRKGNTFTSYKSKDGSNWTQIGSCTIPMGSNCYIGIAATSHNDSKLNDCKFSNITVKQ